MSPPISRRQLLVAGLSGGIGGALAGCLGSGSNYELTVDNRIDFAVTVTLRVLRAESDESVLSDEFELDADGSNDTRTYTSRLSVGTPYTASVDVTVELDRSMTATEEFTLSEGQTLGIDIYNSGVIIGTGEA